MRNITDHVLPGLNEAITISVLDEPGQGGACHEYALNVTAEKLPSYAEALKVLPNGSVTFNACTIRFQNGPIKEFGVNGISQEALLAIVIDRLRSFQAGDYACPDNAEALAHLQGALKCLQRRTRERMARGVEGTNIK